MKRKIFIIFCLLLAFSSSGRAQSISVTGGAAACESCLPSGWIKSNLGSTNLDPSISTQALCAGNQNWNPAVESAPPSGLGTFLSSYNDQATTRTCYTTVSGLISGKSYTLSYNILSSRVNAVIGGGYADSGTLTFSNGAVATQTTTFTPNVNTSKWIPKQLKFTATSSTARLTFSGSSVIGGYVNLDIGFNSIKKDCEAGFQNVALSNDTLMIACSGLSVNLTNLITSPAIPGAEIVWYTTPNHSNSKVNNPGAIGFAGTFYAFYYDAISNCYNTDNSAAKVTVISNPILNFGQVSLTTSTINVSCNGLTTNLNSTFNGVLPDNYKLVWFTDAQRNNPVANAETAGPGTYYAFIVDNVTNCYNMVNSTAKLEVSAPKQVKLLVDVESNTCPTGKFNLNSLLADPVPANTNVVWYKSSANHTQGVVSDPTAVSAGIYYAFYYDTVEECFNTDLSTAKATVMNAPCNVALDVKVFLQGALKLNSAEMSNGLQIYFGMNNSGLLPVSDPYGGGAICPSINNTAVSGKIVDWVKVEIRSAADPSIILQSKSLLLKVDGKIIDVDLTVPSFASQAEAVRIVVKHRNHVAIMSNTIPSFKTGSRTYDFTDLLAKAYNNPQKPSAIQMGLKNGVYFMWAGDINTIQDYIVESSDYTTFKKAFKTNVANKYIPADVNMDGIVESGDVSIFNKSFKAQYNSIISSYP